MTSALRPPIPYYGGKITIASRIVALMPPHEAYAEPYAGSLAVLLAKPRARHETVNDLDEDVVTFWRVLRDHPEDLRRACALTPHSRTEHHHSQQDTTGLEDLERARRVWVQLTQGRAGSRRRTGWRNMLDPHRSTPMPTYLTGYADRILPAARRLAGVSLECRPALDVIADHGRHPDTLLYVDPPYLGYTRNTRGYRHEMTSPTDHSELLEALRGLPAAVILSGYPSPLYDRTLGDWDRIELPSSTCQGGEHSARTEVIWSNRTVLHQDALHLDLPGKTR
jgi:DNA adenine methylase